MGQASLFLGTEFTWVHHNDGNLSVTLTQQSFIETLLDSLNIISTTTSTFTTLYRSGYPIDSVPCVDMPSSACDEFHLRYQSLIGSLNWLAHTMRPDLSTVVSLLAQHQSNSSQGHYDAASYVLHYLAHTKSLGISFSSCRHATLESFLHFPVPATTLSMSDANW